MSILNSYTKRSILNLVFLKCVLLDTNRNRLQSTVFSEKYPTHTTEPTLQCVVDTGTPALLATKTVSAAPNSIVNPLIEKNLIKISV